MKIEKIIKEAGLEQFNWTKVVIGLDKSKNGGYSILGNFTKDTALQDGLYLSVDKGSYDYYVLYKITGEKLNIIKIYENDKKSWAKQFWSYIEENLDLSMGETLFNEIVEKTSDVEDLKELVKRLNYKIEEKENKFNENFDLNYYFNVEDLTSIDLDGIEEEHEDEFKQIEKLAGERKEIETHKALLVYGYMKKYSFMKIQEKYEIDFRECDSDDFKRSLGNPSEWKYYRIGEYGAAFQQYDENKKLKIIYPFI